MHHFLATLFSLLVALCHHTNLSARPVEAAELPGMVQTVPDTAGATMVLPDRYQMARYATEDGGYAGTTCVSCRRMEGSISVR